VWSGKLYASDSVYPFDVDWDIYLILSWGKACDQIGNASVFSEAYHFNRWAVQPLLSVLQSQASPT
jgi:hypothetical protein